MDIKKYQERENLRNQIKEIWKEHRMWTAAEYAVNDRLNAVHAEITEHELQEGTKPKERVVFSVCGYSPKHAYFRAKRFQSESLDEAKADLDLAKKEADWNTPTIIVKETYYRKSCPAMGDFDGGINNLGFSDAQELVEKSMCGNRQYRWNNLISENDERYTY